MLGFVSCHPNAEQTPNWGGGHSKRHHLLDCNEAFVKQCCGMHLSQSKPTANKPLLGLGVHCLPAPRKCESKRLRGTHCLFPCLLNIAASSDFHLLFSSVCLGRVPAQAPPCFFSPASVWGSTSPCVFFPPKLPTLLPQRLNCPVALMLSFRITITDP